MTSGYTSNDTSKTILWSLNPLTPLLVTDVFIRTSTTREQNAQETRVASESSALCRPLSNRAMMRRRGDGACQRYRRRRQSECRQRYAQYLFVRLRPWSLNRRQDAVPELVHVNTIFEQMSHLRDWVDLRPPIWERSRTAIHEVAVGTPDPARASSPGASIRPQDDTILATIRPKARGPTVRTQHRMVAIWGQHVVCGLDERAISVIRRRSPGS